MSTQAADIIRWCRTLAGYSEEPGCTTRACLTGPMHLVHRDLGGWMQRIGLNVHVDAAGNLRGLRPSSRQAARRLYLGSHLDSVPNAGAFDGVLGVVWAIALIERLGSLPLPFELEVIGFSDEEGVRFGAPFIGSRALVGTLDAALLARVDRQGIRLDDALREFRGTEDVGPDPSAAPNAIGYLECHIEQGPVLEQLNLSLGIVTAIVGQTRAEVTFQGTAGHAGTTPMHLRHDATAGAAQWVTMVEREAVRTAGAVATVGRFDTRPGAGNVIAATATVTLDVRHADDRVRETLVGRLRDAADTCASPRGLSIDWSQRLDQPAVAMDEALTTALTDAVTQTGHAPHALASGAGHDAMIMAARMPAAMLFIRSPAGLSHHPDETVREQDVAAALDAGDVFLRRLAVQHG